VGVVEWCSRREEWRVERERMKRAVNREREEFNEEWEEKKIRLGFSSFHIYQATANGLGK
jgi:hypothetical protein